MSLLGVDVGGTFTDFYFWRDGEVQVHKRPSSPAMPALSVLEGMREREWHPEELIHGSTIATNTLLQRGGARTAFVTTKGLRDILTIGRQARPSLYQLEPSRDPPLVPRELCFEADERVTWTGDVIRPLLAGEARRLARRVRESGAATVAVCLLFSFLHPDHESVLASAMHEEGLDVSASHEVLPEPREYERASTTVLNAYVAPAVRAYLGDLEQRLAAAGSPVLRVLQSSGGAASVSQASALPASLLLSGPAGGVAGAFSCARRAGIERIISFDMGGTSTDVSLCAGRIPYTSEWSVAGMPVRLPAVDVHTVGAGGGSIAWMDAGGALRVGPQSAGADPGPACYGRGGPATVTDAQVVLGRLGAASLLGGNMKIDPSAARRAMLAIDRDAVGAAKGTLAVANAVMARALRVVSLERGFDPRDFTLVAFGGAGPLHACDLAGEVSINRVLVPRHPGILSAIGMATADITRDASIALVATGVRTEDSGLNSRVKAALAELGGRLTRELGSATEIEAAVDMRYSGQGYEVTVPWQGGLSLAVDAFHAAHEQRYGHANRNASVDLVVVRARGRVRRALPEAPSLPESGPDASAAVIGRRRVMFDRQREAVLYSRSALLAGNVLEGPALVTQIDSTTLVHPGWRATVDIEGNLIIEARDHA